MLSAGMESIRRALHKRRHGGAVVAILLGKGLPHDGHYLRGIDLSGELGSPVRVDGTTDIREAKRFENAEHLRRHWVQHEAEGHTQGYAFEAVPFH